MIFESVREDKKCFTRRVFVLLRCILFKLIERLDWQVGERRGLLTCVAQE